MSWGFNARRAVVGMMALSLVAAMTLEVEAGRRHRRCRRATCCPQPCASQCYSACNTGCNSCNTGYAACNTGCNTGGHTVYRQPLDCCGQGTYQQGQYNSQYGNQQYGNQQYGNQQYGNQQNGNLQYRDDAPPAPQPDSNFQEGSPSPSDPQTAPAPSGNNSGAAPAGDNAAPPAPSET